MENRSYFRTPKPRLEVLDFAGAVLAKIDWVIPYSLFAALRPVVPTGRELFLTVSALETVSVFDGRPQKLW